MTKPIKTYHTNKITGGEKQKVMRGTKRKKRKLSDMETYSTNKWDSMVDKWIQENEK
jgi:hypothetical protein